MEPHPQEIQTARYQQNIQERLIQGAITKVLSERMGTVAREFNEFTKDMTKADAKEAKIMLLEMSRNAFEEFYTKMKARIEREQ